MRRAYLTLVLIVTLPVVAWGQALTRLASSPQVVGTMTTSGDVIDFPIPIGVGYGSLGVEARGTWTGTVAVQCLASQGGGTYAALILSPRASTTTVTSFTANGQWSASIVGCQKVRATATAAMTGTVTITMIGSFAGGGSGAGGGGGSGSNAAASATGSAVPADADYQGVNVGGTLRGVTGLSVGSVFAPTVALVDGSGNQVTSFGGGTQYVGDAGATATPTGTMAMGLANASAPADVSANNDAVAAWYLRSGAQVTQPTFGGVIAVAGNGASGTGVQRVTLANDSTGVIATVGAVTSITNTVNTLGTLGNDANAATTNRIPTLPVVTETSAPSRTNGRNAALSGTAGGAIRVMISDAAGAATAIATDSTNDSAASSTGPQVMALAEATTPSAVSDGDSVRLWADLVGALKVASAYDPCSAGAKTLLAINIAAATTTEITPSLAGASNNYYICSLNLVSAGANNVALVDDDSDNCGSVTSGLAGGTSAASGWNFAANGGMTIGNGLGTVFKTNGTNRVVCIVTSGTGQLSGSIGVVAAP